MSSPSEDEGYCCPMFGGDGWPQPGGSGSALDGPCGQVLEGSESTEVMRGSGPPLALYSSFHNPFVTAALDTPSPRANSAFVA